MYSGVAPRQLLGPSRCDNGCMSSESTELIREGLIKFAENRNPTCLRGGWSPDIYVHAIVVTICTEMLNSARYRQSYTKLYVASGFNVGGESIVPLQLNPSL